MVGLAQQKHENVNCALPLAVKDSNTTNLHSHLKYKHPEKYSIVQSASKKRWKKEKCLTPASHPSQLYGRNRSYYQHLLGNARS